MNRKDTMLRLFRMKRDFTEDRIRNGIETNRKSFAFLEFSDSEGRPLRNVHVRARLKNHEFRIGGNLFMLEEFPRSEQNAAYREYFADIFNIATLPFYWRDLEVEQGKPRFAADSPKVYRRPAPDLCLEYCEKHGIEPKAHCLNYAGFAPAWAQGTLEKEKRLLAKRFRELAERYSGRIPSWEVTNETFWNFEHVPFRFYREADFVEWSFHTARQYFPGNRLIINEASPFCWEYGTLRANRSLYYMQIERALRNGASIDSIGMQFHMFFPAEDEEINTVGKGYYDPEQLYAVLDTYAALGRNIQITEVTVPAYSPSAEDEETQAEILRQLYSIWFSHPATEGIIYWNLVDGFAHGAVQGDMASGENYYHGGLIRYDFTPKAAYFMIRDLFKKEWTTSIEADSGDSSGISFKGFHGDYELEITAEGKGTVQRNFSLSRDGLRHFRIVL